MASPASHPRNTSGGRVPSKHEGGAKNGDWQHFSRTNAVNLIRQTLIPGEMVPVPDFSRARPPVDNPCEPRHWYASCQFHPPGRKYIGNSPGKKGTGTVFRVTSVDLYGLGFARAKNVASPLFPRRHGRRLKSYEFYISLRSLRSMRPIKRTGRTEVHCQHPPPRRLGHPFKTGTAHHFSRRGHGDAFAPSV